MGDERIAKSIRGAILVERAMVTTAMQKVAAFALSASGAVGARQLIDHVLTAMGLPRDLGMVVTSDAEESSKVSAVALALSWRIATAEAVWSLVSDSVLLPVDSALTASTDAVSVKVDRGGSSTSWTVDIDTLGMPCRLTHAPSLRGPQTLLSSGDLFLAQLDCSSMHPDVQQAVIDAVECFKRGLLLPAAAVLGKVSEGAWMELGSVLIAAVPVASASSVQKQRACLESPMTGLMEKIAAVKVLYAREELAWLRSRIGKRISLDAISLWSDLVRGSRNTIHFSAEPPTPVTWESLAVQFLTASTHLRDLYAIRSEAVTGED